MSLAIIHCDGLVLNPEHSAGAINNPIALETLKFLANMVAEDIMARPKTPGMAVPFLATNKVGMFTVGSYVAKQYVAQGVDFGIALLPKGKDRRVVYGASDVIAMSATVKNPEAGWALLREYAVGRPPEYYAKAGWFPIEQRLATSKVIMDAMSKNKIDYPVIIESVNYMENNASANWTNWINATRPIIDKALYGQISPEDALLQAEAEINKWLTMQ